MYGWTGTGAAEASWSHLVHSSMLYAPDGVLPVLSELVPSWFAGNSNGAVAQLYLFVVKQSFS